MGLSVKTTIFLFFLTIVTLTLFCELATKVTPLNPLQYFLGEDSITLGREHKQNLIQDFSLDKRFGTQSYEYLRSLLNFDLGASKSMNKPIRDIVLEKLSLTIPLVFSTFMILLLIGPYLAFQMAYHETRFFDRFFMGLFKGLLMAPSFWWGTLILFIFSYKLELVPFCCSFPIEKTLQEVTFFDRFHHAILPVLTLVLMNTSYLVIHLREKMIEILKGPYILHAKMMGNGDRRSLLFHIWPNAFLPGVTLIFYSLTEIFAGSIIVEELFSYPGFGKLTMDAILSGDFPLLATIILLMATFVFLGNLMVRHLRGRL